MQADLAIAPAELGWISLMQVRAFKFCLVAARPRVESTVVCSHAGLALVRTELAWDDRSQAEGATWVR